MRLDMSEYQERHTVSRLMGAPPGYVGYEEGGQLTEAVRRKPYSVVLFDEIEKAHPDVFNTLLQILDDGRLTDAQGRTVNFRNTVIIMTSNIGSLHLLDGLTRGRRDLARTPATACWPSCARHFRPEFLNRVDETVLFKPLTLEEIEHIVDLQIEDLRRAHGRPPPGDRGHRGRARADRTRGLRPRLRRPPAAPLHPAQRGDADRARRDRRRHPRRRDDHARRRPTASSWSSGTTAAVPASPTSRPSRRRSSRRDRRHRYRPARAGSRTPPRAPRSCRRRAIRGRRPASRATRRATPGSGSRA